MPLHTPALVWRDARGTSSVVPGSRDLPCFITWARLSYCLKKDVVTRRLHDNIDSKQSESRWKDETKAKIKEKTKHRSGYRTTAQGTVQPRFIPEISFVSTPSNQHQPIPKPPNAKRSKRSEKEKFSHPTYSPN
ncbi:hypothetical protein KC323_g203 [Hortaea werneckii]|nr:hypothetical protein KC323_g203 [Hortaea werneckii]